MKPLNEISPRVLQNIRLVATDMDGTLTQRGKFTPALLESLQALQQAEIPVVIVTGRSAGWVDGVVSYLPVVGAIAENGGLFFKERAEFLVPITDVEEHRQKLAAMFRELQADFPQIVPASDNPFRLTDWTFDVHGLDDETLRIMRDRCLARGWGFTYSTVQCHIKPLEQEKASALLKVLQTNFPNITPDQVLTVGDSPNDESLFEGDRFPYSIGVANVRHYAAQLIHKPTYITENEEATGFCEIAQKLLAQN